MRRGRVTPGAETMTPVDHPPIHIREQLFDRRTVARNSSVSSKASSVFSISIGFMGSTAIHSRHFWSDFSSNSAPRIRATHSEARAGYRFMNDSTLIEPPWRSASIARVRRPFFAPPNVYSSS